VSVCVCVKSDQKIHCIFNKDIKLIVEVSGLISIPQTDTTAHKDKQKREKKNAAMRGTQTLHQTISILRNV